MKFILLVLSIFFSTLTLSSQDIVNLTPARVDTLFQVDISNSFEDLVAHGLIKNKTKDTLYIKWKRRVLTIPNGWDTKICDANLCYVEIVDSNIDPDLLLEEPVIIPPYGSANLDVHIVPNGAVGTGLVEIELSLLGLPDDIIGVAEYQMEVKNLNYSRAANNRKSLRVYPNPSSNFINVSSNSLIEKVVVYNMVGREVKSFKANRSGVYDITDLRNGIYLVGLYDKTGEIIKTTRVTKKRPISP